jgi:hypothetical protein
MPYDTCYEVVNGGDGQEDGPGARAPAYDPPFLFLRNTDIGDQFQFLQGLQQAVFVKGDYARHLAVLDNAVSPCVKPLPVIIGPERLAIAGTRDHRAGVVAVRPQFVLERGTDGERPVTVPDEHQVDV